MESTTVQNDHESSDCNENEAKEESESNADSAGCLYMRYIYIC